MADTLFKMSDKAFYRSQFSGILPCVIVEVGLKKIRILIEGYNSKLWVSMARIISTADFAAQKEKPLVGVVNKIRQKIPVVIQQPTPLLGVHKE